MGVVATPPPGHVASKMAGARVRALASPNYKSPSASSPSSTTEVEAGSRIHKWMGNFKGSVKDIKCGVQSCKWWLDRTLLTRV